MLTNRFSQIDILPHINTVVPGVCSRLSSVPESSGMRRN